MLIDNKVLGVIYTPKALRNGELRMEEIENIAENLCFNREEGSLTFKGVRYILIRPETIVRIQKEVEKAVGSEAQSILASGGFEGGSLSARTYREKFGLSKEEIVEYMCNMGSSIGWGRFKLVELSDGHIVIEVRNSPFAEKYGRSEKGVCHLISGVLAGLGRMVLESEVESHEESCISRGEGLCRFVVSKRSED